MPISRVRCVTDTSVVLVTTTIAAMSAISEMGGPAAPSRSVIAVTKLRDASGVMMSNVSAAPGPRCRRARIEIRAWSSAACVRATSVAFANTCRLGAAPNARSNAAIGIHT